MQYHAEIVNFYLHADKLTCIYDKVYVFVIRFTASAFRKLLPVYVFSYFTFGFEGRMWDLIVSVPDHCLSFYFVYITGQRLCSHHRRTEQQQVIQCNFNHAIHLHCTLTYVLTVGVMYFYFD